MHRSPAPFRSARRTRGLRPSALLAVLLLGLAPAAPCLAAPAADAGDEGPFAHLRALGEIAAANGGNRAAGTPGYDRSADYVAGRLREAGYDVRFEEFTFPFFEERSPPRLLAGADGTAAPGGELRTLANSGSGDVAARLIPVDLGLSQGAPPPSTSGCEPSDFAGFERGAVALVRRGTCPFQVKADLATAAGASALVVMNEGVDDRTGVVAGRLNAASIPVVGVSFALGRKLEADARDGGVVRVAVDAASGTRSTRNVLAERPASGSGELIVVGAHLDGVPQGPGINDNGSGSAAVLEAALRLARTGGEGTRRVRFAFWGAEEIGLVGSRHHVEALSDEGRREIKLYVNLDMVGSPNFGRFVHSTGRGDAALAATASRAILDAFRSRGLPVEERSGRGLRGYGSDDASFARAGIPTVGLYTGAGEPKGEDKAALFGGAAGQPYDRCYHRACDTVENVDRAVLEQMTDALFRAVEVLARGG